MQAAAARLVTRQQHVRTEKINKKKLPKSGSTGDSVVPLITPFPSATAHSTLLLMAT